MARGRDDRLAAGALVAAADAVDLGGGAGPDRAPGWCVRPRRGWRATWRCAASCSSSKGSSAKSSRSRSVEFGDAVVEAGDRHPRVARRAGRRPGGRRRWPGWGRRRRRSRSGCPGRARGGRSRTRRGRACRCTPWGCPRTTCRCRRRSRRRRRAGRRASSTRARKCDGAGLLLALDEQLQVDGGGGAAGGGEVGADAECVEEHLALVVGGAARVQAAFPDDRFEGVACPSRPRRAAGCTSWWP